MALAISCWASRGVGAFDIAQLLILRRTTRALARVAVWGAARGGVRDRPVEGAVEVDGQAGADSTLGGMERVRETDPVGIHVGVVSGGVDQGNSA